MKPLRFLLATAALAAASVTAWAQAPVVKVEGAWARATVQGQKGTGAFMRLTAVEPVSLVGISSPVAGVAEVHEMKMDGDVMRMRAMAALELPAGKTVELKPGGYHLMLMDLKAPLKADTTIPVTLQLRNARGEVSSLELSVPVAAKGPAAMPMPGGHGPMHKH